MGAFGLGPGIAAFRGFTIQLGEQSCSAETVSVLNPGLDLACVLLTTLIKLEKYLWEILLGDTWGIFNPLPK